MVVGCSRFHFGFADKPKMRVPLDKNEGVVKTHGYGRVLRHENQPVRYVVNRRILKTEIRRLGPVTIASDKRLSRP